MARTIGAFAVVGSLVLGACGVGDEGAETDNRDEQLGIVCSATFSTTGTFTAAAPLRPADQTGCWPVGTWTFTAKVETNDCPEAPVLAASYSFKVDRAVNPDPTKDIGYEESYTYFGDQSMLQKLDVTAVGAGCEAGLELFSTDGTKFWNLKPLLKKDGTMAGFGEYEVYHNNEKL